MKEIPMVSLRQHTLKELTDCAGLKFNISGYYEPNIFSFTHKGEEENITHYEKVAFDNKTCYVDITTFENAQEEEKAIRVLEYLAYSFFDYGAREIMKSSINQKLLCNN